MNRFLNHGKKRVSGQSMIEIMVVVGVVALLVTGLVSATTATLRFSQMSKIRAQALQYAKEGLEVVRIVKEEDWNSIPNTSATTTYCLAKGQQSLGTVTLVECPMTIDSTFSRTVVFSDEGPCTAASSCRKVTVTVSFKEQDQTRSVPLTSYITGWRMR